ncbi:hypothetical protein SLA2020_528210 [Shorea laevis]
MMKFLINFYNLVWFLGNFGHLAMIGGTLEWQCMKKDESICGSLQHSGLIANDLLGEAWIAVWFATVWSKWLWRNQEIFNEEVNPVSKVMDIIKFKSFYWIKASIWDGLSQDLWHKSLEEAFNSFRCSASVNLGNL